MSLLVGIDLGTTYSAIARIDETGRPVIVHNDDGENITPSCIAQKHDGVLEVGEFARKEMCIARQRAVGRFKRDMGTSNRYCLGDDELSPTDLSALVLTKLRQFTEDACGSITEAVVTVPANFSNEAREATIAAARAAGLTVNHVINEPTAAALYYAFWSDSGLSGNYAVYDLGGGTFDVSIINVNGQEVTVLATNGVARLGGDDFDRALLDIVQRKFEAQFDEEIEAEDFTVNDAEEQKKSLSKRDSVTTRIARKNVKITRQEFEESISSWLAQTEMLCESTIEEAGIEPEDIREVLLAGGSTRIPAVRESVSRVFGREPTASVNPDEIVALGAALYAAKRCDQSELTAVQKKAIDKIDVTECASHCFGTIIYSHNEARDEHVLVNEVLIPKGQTIPFSVSGDYVTISEGQEAWECKVTQSTNRETDPRFVNVVAKAVLELPPGRPAGQKLKVHYAYTEDGRMTADFVDVATGKQQRLELALANEEETASSIDKFIVE